MGRTPAETLAVEKGRSESTWIILPVRQRRNRVQFPVNSCYCGVTGTPLAILILRGLQVFNATIWIAVTVEDKATGIRGVHYVEVDKNWVHPELQAAQQEYDKGYKIISARKW